MKLWVEVGRQPDRRGQIVRFGAAMGGIFAGSPRSSSGSPRTVPQIRSA